jgi:cytoskeletal protein CcmA (bactofilin family)
VSDVSDLRVERGSSAKLERIDGELKVGSNARISAAKGKLVSVTGGAHFEGNAEIDCDFECASLKVDRGKLKVTGDLTVHEGLDAAHTVEAEGAIRAHDIDVGGKMFARSISCVGSIRVGGLVVVKETLEAASVGVGGKVAVSGKVKIADFGVGGKADVGGGSITGHTQVGGLFASTAPLEFGELQVYGRCTLPADCKGRKISTFGKLSVEGSITCERVEVAGAADVRGDLNAAEVLVNGKLGISGSLSVKGTLEANGSCELGGELRSDGLRVGGRFKARKAVLSDRADLAGEVETEEGLRARSVVIRGGTRCKGPLVGERVELGKSQLVLANWGSQWAGQSVMMRGIGRMTAAQDIYGAEVVLGANSRCRKIVANRVELEDGCVVDQVTYTDELRAKEGRVYLVHPPEKVTKLPPFPL